jgi:hypothetical protein
MLPDNPSRVVPEIGGNNLVLRVMAVVIALPYRSWPKFMT